MYKKINTPLNDELVQNLKAGDKVLISGYIYTARDAAHKRMYETLKKGQMLPIDIKGQIIYYAGPCPAKPGMAVGPAGPTTSGRMDKYTPDLIKLGLKGMIGKGERSAEVIQAIKNEKAVYFAATGGAAVLISMAIKEAETVAYEDLGTEAIRKLWVEDFPAIVVIDSEGNNLYETEKEKYKRSSEQRKTDVEV